MSKLEHAGASTTTPPARRQSRTPSHGFVHDDARVDRRRVGQRPSISGAASPIATIAGAALADDVGQVPELAALVPPAHDGDDAVVEAFERAARGDAMFVAFESLTNAHAVDLGDALERVLKAA